ncbi:unnamed protein product [Ranitomeya imitator]|uniref:Transposase n=1 Tax=Ranitomeya imitator TaxID=111125 RepID=A0ABN9MF26_9NEOB|nr:unnamed protein product [Ranitomeya imitator]
MEKRKKTKELSEDLRNQIVRKHEQSQGYKSISKDLNVPVSTVRSVIKKCKAHGTVANLPRCGRKRKIDKRFQRKIVRMLDKEPRLTSKQDQAALQSEGTAVSTRTIRRRLNEKGLYGRRPRKTPLLTPRHKKARLEFAKTYLKKPKTFWKYVLWSDKTKQLLSTKLPYYRENVCLAYGLEWSVYAVGSQAHVSFLDPRQPPESAKSVYCKEQGSGIRSVSFYEHIITVGTGQGSLLFYDIRAQRFLDYSTSYFNSSKSKGDLLKLTTGKGWLRGKEDHISQDPFCHQGILMRSSSLGKKIFKQRQP